MPERRSNGSERGAARQGAARSAVVLRWGGGAAALLLGVLVVPSVGLLGSGRSGQGLERSQAGDGAEPAAAAIKSGATGATGATGAKGAATAAVAAMREPTSAALTPGRLPDVETLRRLARRGQYVFVGKVLDPAGASAADVPLFLHGREIARSAANGDYAVEVASSRAGDLGWWMAARAPGRGVAVCTLAPPSRRIDLVLERGAKVKGRAIDWRSRTPAVGAIVELRTAPPDGGSLPIGGAGRGPAQRIVSALELEARVDAEGRFEFTDLPADSFVMRAQSAAGDTLAWRQYSGAQPGGVFEVVLELRAKVAVKGWFSPWPPHPGPRAANGGGRPLAGPWRVTASAEREVTATPDADGRFELQLTEYAHWTLELDAGPGTRRWVETLPLGPDAPAIEFGRIELREPSLVVGEVPPAWRAVDLGLRIGGVATLGESRESIDAPIGTDGSFTIGPAAMDDCYVVLELPAAARWSEGRLAGSEPVELRWIEPGAIVEARFAAGVGWAFGRTLMFGRVVDEEGAPVASAEFELDFEEEVERFVDQEVGPEGDGADVVEAAAPTGATIRRMREAHRGVADFDGRFAAAILLPPGTSMEVIASGHGRCAASPFVLGSGIHDLGDVVIGGGRVLRARLVDRAGSPLGGVRIEISDRGGREWADWTAHDGTIEFRGLEAREYRPEMHHLDGYSFLPRVAAGVTDVVWTWPSEADE